MPYKDKQKQRDVARARYYQKVYGIPSPLLKPKKTPEEQKTHRKQYFEEYYSRPEVKIRAHDNALRRTYGITYDDKVKMYEEQKGLCALCNDPLPAEISKAHVDHNHKTGEIRKLLHKQCNSVIAYFEDSPSRIDTLLDYLLVKKGG